MYRKPNYLSETAFKRRMINLATMSEFMMRKYSHDKMFANHHRFFQFCTTKLNISFADMEKYRWQNEFEDKDYWKQVFRLVRTFNDCLKFQRFQYFQNDNLFSIMSLTIPMLIEDYNRWVSRKYQFALELIRETNGSDVVDKALDDWNYPNNPRRTFKYLAKHPDYRVREAVYSQIDLLDDNLKKIVLANI